MKVLRNIWFQRHQVQFLNGRQADSVSRFLVHITVGKSQRFIWGEGTYNK